MGHMDNDSKVLTCFVIQPFDGERFDKRYDDVFAPAIRSAGLEPYRVDQDPSARVVIEEIERGIAASHACLAEISTDNPNVWYELGYAIASNRDVVLVCSDERKTHFPFDVQHRAVIKYSTDSPSDFDKVRSEITERLEAVLNTQNDPSQLAEPTTDSKIDGLEPHEIAILVALAQNVGDPEADMSAHDLGHNIKQVGFTQLAVTLGLKVLIDRNLIERDEAVGDYGEPYGIFKLTSQGLNWLLANREGLALREPKSAKPEAVIDSSLPNDGIPF